VFTALCTVAGYCVCLPPVSKPVSRQTDNQILPVSGTSVIPSKRLDNLSYFDWLAAALLTLSDLIGWMTSNPFNSKQYDWPQDTTLLTIT
jgi:hypothetical protein